MDLLHFNDLEKPFSIFKMFPGYLSGPPAEFPPRISLCPSLSSHCVGGLTENLPHRLPKINLIFLISVSLLSRG